MLSSWRKLIFRRSIEIPQRLWDQQLRALPWLYHWDARELDELRALCARFLADKSMTGAAGLELTASMQLHIAAQACVPIARLGLKWYGGWSGIVVYPASFRVRREVPEPSGVVQQLDAELTGEAWAGGPVVLSWEDAAPGPDPIAAGGAAGAGVAPSALAQQTRTQGRVGNVVIHEFAHKLDLLDGEANGVPPFDPRLHSGLERRHWQDQLEDAYERFCAELELIDSELAPDVDPEGADAERFYAHLPLDPYAGTDPAEFFAVSSEAFFVRPDPLAAAFPQWYQMLRRFYRPDRPRA